MQKEVVLQLFSTCPTFFPFWSAVVILCGESIARIPEAWECFPDHDSGKWVFCIEAKIWNFWIFLLKFRSKGYFMREIDSASSKRCGRNIIFQGRWSRMHFDASGMRWIDFSYKITLRTMILEEKSKTFIFSLQYTHLFPWIRIKEAFSRFGNARNRFFA